jgi:hypothetical protein
MMRIRSQRHEKPGHGTGTEDPVHVHEEPSTYVGDWYIGAHHVIHVIFWAAGYKRISRKEDSYVGSARDQMTRIGKLQTQSALWRRCPVRVCRRMYGRPW